MRTPAWILALVLASPPLAGAATITIVNLDGVGEGFNDPSVVAPAGGNAGTTLGQQRLNAFQHAADIWGALVNSSVTISVAAAFDPLPCSMSSAVLGAAGPVSMFRDFVGAPVASTWYAVALANSLAGTDLDPGVDDIDATFNSVYGNGCPFPNSFYLGLDGNPPSGETDLVTVLLHEMGHGLGFLSGVDLATGAKLGGLDDAYILGLEDHSLGLLYPAMSNGQRVTASTDTGDLHFVGTAVVAASGSLSGGVGPGGHVHMYAPAVQEPGSSVSHFSNTVTPDEIMEPAYTAPDHSPGLALDLCADLGWSTNAPTCGDGVVDAGETCDDGDTTPGDGCGLSCTVETCFACTGAPSSCSPITMCVDGDACCPLGCTAATDNDCIAVIPALSPPAAVLLAALLAVAMLRTLTVRARR
jgi:cysteine-rich repeat protein